MIHSGSLYRNSSINRGPTHLPEKEFGCFLKALSQSENVATFAVAKYLELAAPKPLMLRGHIEKPKYLVTFPDRFRERLKEIAKFDIP